MSEDKKICVYSVTGDQALFGDYKNTGGGGNQLVSLFYLLGNRYNTVYAANRVGLSTDIKLPENMLITFDMYRGIPFFRIFYIQIPALYRLIKNSDSEIFITRTTSRFVGILAYFCKKLNKKFVYCVASNSDVDTLSCFKDNEGEKIFPLTRWLDDSLFRYGLKNCDQIIVQTHYQKKKLIEKKIKKPIKKINNLINKKFREFSKNNYQNQGEKKYFLWIGKIFRKVKNFELIINLALDLPEINFTILGANTGYDYTPEKLSKIRSINNIVLCDEINYFDLPYYYQNSLGLINTSTVEGFPNTFIEAWLNNCIVLTFSFDPDGIIKKNEIGICCNQSYMKLKKYVIDLNNKPHNFNYIRNKAHKYVIAEYDDKDILENWVKIINKL